MHQHFHRCHYSSIVVEQGGEGGGTTNELCHRSENRLCLRGLLNQGLCSFLSGIASHHCERKPWHESLCESRERVGTHTKRTRSCSGHVTTKSHEKLVNHQPELRMRQQFFPAIVFGSHNRHVPFGYVLQRQEEGSHEFNKHVRQLVRRLTGHVNKNSLNSTGNVIRVYSTHAVRSGGTPDR